MAGRGKISKWGGKRPGAGRKPAYMLTENQIAAMLRTARNRAKTLGKTIDEVLLDVIYAAEDKSTVRDKLAAIRLFKEFTMSKQSEQNINVTQKVGPRIGLPPVKGEDPALKIMSGGKD